MQLSNRRQDSAFLIDPSVVGLARRSPDVAGHNSRPDVFELKVNTGAQKPISFE